MDRLNKLVSESLQRQPLGTHPGADTLAAFAENALGRPERQQTLAHLAECSDCREILYLAPPNSAAAQDVVVYRPNRITHFALRWGAVAASLVIVAGGLFITRHELLRSEYLLSEQKSAQKPASGAYYDKLADKKAPPELDSLRNAEAPAATKQLSAAVTKTRPAEKHMTAKLQANMSFDESGQVRVQNRKESPGTASEMDASGLIAQADKKSKERDDSGSSSAPSAATIDAAGGYVAQNRVDAKDMPRATNESVGVSAAAPAVQTESEQAIGTGSVKVEAPQSDMRASKQNGAFMKALATPIAHWELSPKGGVQRSFDSGKTWQNVVVDGNDAGFRAVFSSGVQVWVGGAAGALYHSTDAGLTWTQVIPAAGGQKLQSDVSHIEFSDPQTGVVTASNGETWLTSDGGQTWRRK
jgi:Photosynthesis system II assembly factor YCF48/Putative zinc-finger